MVPLDGSSGILLVGVGAVRLTGQLCGLAVAAGVRRAAAWAARQGGGASGAGRLVNRSSGVLIGAGRWRPGPLVDLWASDLTSGADAGASRRADAGASRRAAVGHHGVVVQPVVAVQLGLLS